MAWLWGAGGQTQAGGSVLGEALLSVLGLVFSVWGGSVWRDAVGFQGTKWNLTFKISI